MNKNNKLKLEETLPDDVGNKIETVQLKDVAFSLAKNKKTGAYHVVTINYDFDTKTVGEVQISPESNDEKMIVFDNMKIAIGKYIWS